MLSFIKKGILDEIKEVKAKIRWIEANDLYESHEDSLRFLEHKLEELNYELAKLG